MFNGRPTCQSVSGGSPHRKLVKVAVLSHTQNRYTVCIAVLYVFFFKCYPTYAEYKRVCVWIIIYFDSVARCPDKWTAMTVTNYSTLWWLVGCFVLCEMIAAADQHLDFTDSEIIDGQYLRIANSISLLSTNNSENIDPYALSTRVQYTLQ